MTEQEEFVRYRPVINSPFSAGKIAQSLNVLLTPDGALALATEAGTEGPYIIRPVAAAFLREKLRV
jgi:hypothetical protein